MRRIIGLILVGLGAFLIVIAVVLPTYIAGQVIKFPLNEYETATLTATNASYFSPIKLTQINGANLQATYTIKGNGDAGSARIAVWNEFSYVYDLTNKLEVEPMSRTFAFDRKTAELVNCCGESINGNSSIRQTGIIGYVFPFNTQKQTYQVFDTTLLKPVPFVYSGTETVNGIQTYKFVENVPPTKIGFSQLSSTEPEYYSLRLTYWVDPETGALLSVNEDQDQYLVNPITNVRTTTLFKADLITTPATVKTVVGLDKNGRNEIALIKTILPMVLGIVGALALIVGFLLSRKPREQVQSGLAAATYPSPDAPDAAAAHQSTAPLVPGLAEATEAERPEVQ